jgi:hypothetical protein
MYLICIYMYTFKNICAYHIKNHIRSLWLSCCQVGSISYTFKPGHVVNGIEQSPVLKGHFVTVLQWKIHMN